VGSAGEELKRDDDFGVLLANPITNNARADKKLLVEKQVKPCARSLHSD
jgi:hypothetical protein